MQNKTQTDCRSEFFNGDSFCEKIRPPKICYKISKGLEKRFFSSISYVFP